MFWQTLDSLQGYLSPRQSSETYHELLHEIPIPIWVGDWPAVKQRLESMTLPDPVDFEDWLNSEPELRLEIII